MKHQSCMVVSHTLPNKNGVYTLPKELLRKPNLNSLILCPTYIFAIARFRFGVVLEGAKHRSGSGGCKASFLTL
jgi:hypothetical protein